jgi:hypothetical protein
MPWDAGLAEPDRVDGSTRIHGSFSTIDAVHQGDDGKNRKNAENYQPDHRDHLHCYSELGQTQDTLD